MAKKNTTKGLETAKAEVTKPAEPAKPAAKAESPKATVAAQPAAPAPKAEALKSVEVVKPITQATKAEAAKPAPATPVETPRMAPVKAEAKTEPRVEAAKPSAPRAVKAKPATGRNVFALHFVPGAPVLTEAVSGGVVTAPRLKPGCTVEVSYLKEFEQPLATARLHARLDGEVLEPKSLGHTDADGRFVRTPANLELRPGAQKLEYWFELTTADGRTLWDSNWGRNHWLEVEAGAATTNRAS